MFEKFTNDDFLRLEVTDFRSIRYKKKMLYDRELEFIEEFEDDEAAQDRLAQLKKHPEVSGLKQKEGYFSESDLVEDSQSAAALPGHSKDLWNHQIFKFRKGTAKAHFMATSGDEDDEMEVRRPMTRLQESKASLANPVD